MQKYDVWVYPPNDKGEHIEEYFGEYEGYLEDIISASLTLNPTSAGIYVRLTTETA